jgi:hypothetical protein
MWSAGTLQENVKEPDSQVHKAYENGTAFHFECMHSAF